MDGVVKQGPGGETMKRGPSQIAVAAGGAAMRLAFRAARTHPNGKDLRAVDHDGVQYRLKIHPATGWVLIERETHA